MGTLKLREVRSLGQGDTASKWKSWDVNTDQSNLNPDQSNGKAHVLSPTCSTDGQDHQPQTLQVCRSQIELGDGRNLPHRVCKSEDHWGPLAPERPRGRCARSSLGQQSPLRNSSSPSGMRAHMEKKLGFNPYPMGTVNTILPSPSGHRAVGPQDSSGFRISAEQGSHPSCAIWSLTDTWAIIELQGIPL